jgi:hypothetical protein
MDYVDGERVYEALYWLAYGGLTVSGAISVCIGAIYATAVLAPSPPYLLIVWFVGLLALAATPTVTAEVLDGIVKLGGRRIALPSPESNCACSSPGEEAGELCRGKVRR